MRFSEREQRVSQGSDRRRAGEESCHREKVVPERRLKAGEPRGVCWLSQVGKQGLKQRRELLAASKPQIWCHGLESVEGRGSNGGAYLLMSPC